MKKIITFSILFFVLSIQAQLKNVNPDLNAEPWLVGDLRIPSQKELSKIPVFELSQKYLHRSSLTLPSILDNTTQAYFRPIFLQSDGSCGQSSGVAYNFTYEINRERNLSASSSLNQYPSHYTYNFLNDGDGYNGTWYVDGWEIIKANGCPNVAIYGGSLDAKKSTGWMSGYQNYELSMSNRVKDYFAIDVSTPEGLETLKHWLYDHLENTPTGSLANFAAGIYSDGYNEETDAQGNLIITNWGSEPNHAMTFVGWDDNISYDYNKDGQITNDIDINGDGIVDMRDWEKGALLMVNSWGTSWGNNGKAYVMYQVLAKSLEEGGIVGKKVFAVRAKYSQTSQLKMRIKMSHESRQLIKIAAGISSDINSDKPTYILEFPLFNKQGGDYPMQGDNNDPIEISLDISPLLSYISPNSVAKYFLVINETGDVNNDKNGIVYDFSIVDNSNQEYICSQHNVSLNNNNDTLLSIIETINFNKPQIDTNSLPEAAIASYYSYDMTVSEGEPDYQWQILQYYDVSPFKNEVYPSITTNKLTFSDNDDDYVEQIIDFNFLFYGTYYNRIYVSTDGYIRFEPGFEYIREKSTIKNNKMISVFASDLKLFTSEGDAVYYEGDANHATFRWKASTFDGADNNVDVALTLYSNGDIKLFYGNDITAGLKWVAGVSNGEGSSEFLNILEDNPKNQAFIFKQKPFPSGMSISKDGIFHGLTPSEENTWQIDFKVIDNNNIFTIKTLEFTTKKTNIVSENNFNNLKVHPNPIIDRTVFSYELKNKDNVSLIVYDLSGKQIETLLQKTQQAGSYHIIWYPNLPKGVYIYHLLTKQGISKGKILIK